jgi:catechol 2,3-dioxygenase-like lactoylglutathione lyase family enzyme
MRVQLALNVRNLERAVDYYGRLFDAVPHKRRPGYANFVIDRPPLKLVLIEQSGATEHLNHLGVEVLEPTELETAVRRLRQQGLTATPLASETCCHAVQDKIWSIAPDGEPWEWYRITDDQPAQAADVCCA